MGTPIRTRIAPAAPADHVEPGVQATELRHLHDHLSYQIDDLCRTVALHVNPSFMPAMPRLPQSSPSRIAVIAAIEKQRFRLDFLAMNALVAHDTFSRMEQITADLVNAELGRPLDGRRPRRSGAPTVTVQPPAPPPPDLPFAPFTSSANASFHNGSQSPRSYDPLRRSRLCSVRTNLVAQAEELLKLHHSMLARVPRDHPRPPLSLNATTEQIVEDLQREGQTLRHLASVCRLAANGFEGLERSCQQLLRPVVAVRDEAPPDPLI